MKIQIGRELFDNVPECRAYHVRAKLTDMPVEVGTKNEDVENSILASILAIDGVAAAQLNPYTVSVIKAKMFSWEEVEPNVKADRQGAGSL